VQGGGGPQAIETSEVERSIRLQFVDAFGHRNPFPDQYVSRWKEGSWAG